MPDTKRIVINTGPLIALVAALGDLKVLRSLYSEVIVPFEGCQVVCIDETVGRRIAKLNGLMLTGTVGILLRAKKEGLSFSMKDAIQRMTSKGVWLSGGVIEFALYHAG